eukprot:scaffold8102_cov73-Cyclotella_meneghiniana.AAC.23
MSNLSPFPPCTPVWYHLHQTSEFNHQTILRIYEGVVSSSSVLLGSVKREYQVFQCTENKSTNCISVDTVDESCLAFAPQCPVTVSLNCDTATARKINGEIVNVHFSPCIHSKEILIRYTVKMYIDDGDILIEDGMSVERLQYRFGLDELRLNLKGDCCAKKMIGIRTDSLGIPMQKGKLRRKSTTTKHPIRKQSIFVQLLPNRKQKAKNILRESLPRSVDNVSYREEDCTVPTTEQKMCRNKSCNHNAQENFDGYCFKHYFLFLRGNNSANSTSAAAANRNTLTELESKNATSLTGCAVATDRMSETKFKSGMMAKLVETGSNPNAHAAEDPKAHSLIERQPAMNKTSPPAIGYTNQSSDVIDLTEDD